MQTLLLLVLPAVLPAQVLSFEDFIRQVQEQHPEARRAGNLTETFRAERLAARGGFDPKLFGDYEQKYFNGKNYYATGAYGLKIPTRFGTEISAYYQTASGDYLNPENKLPSAGQAVLGVSQPLWQGLLFDERRAALLSAEQGARWYEAGRRNALNDLTFRAATDYWKWVFAFEQRRIYAEALTVAQQRFRNIRATWELGESMAMDTLESYLQVQDRQIQYNDADLVWQAATAKLGNHMWPTENNRIPDTLALLIDEADDPAINPADLEREMLERHPELAGYSAKIERLETERRLKREKLKPKVQLNYNLLGDGLGYPSGIGNDYKWGIGFSSPLLLRAERGELQLTRLKLENSRLELEQKTRELQNKLQAALADWTNARLQLAQYRQAVDNYGRLLDMELTRFGLGESTFFLVNNREMKYLDARVKLAKYQSEVRISRFALDWVTGKLATSPD